MSYPKPFPEGTIVTGRDPVANLHAWMEHQDHLWRVDAAMKSTSQGWVQAATCIVDGQRTVPLIWWWWTEKANKKHLRRTLSVVREDISSLREARDFIKEELRKILS